MLALPLAAQAQVTGVYIGAAAGPNFMQQEAINGATLLGRTRANGGGDLHFGVGATGLGAVGYGFGNGLRAELEADYRYNGLQSVSGANGGSVNVPSGVAGKEQKYGPMVNVLYDFNGISPVVVPYIGAGVGYQWVNESLSDNGFSGNQTKGSFAVQAILGAAFPIPPVPGLSVTADYRFLALTGNRKYTIGNTGGVTLGNDFNHAIMIGLRYEFGVAPPPAPTPVAEVGAKTFLVFFDWDRADLTARSQAIVHDAADYSTHSQYTRIDVDGNTDTSGTPQYNMGLSERRARTVAAELVRDGVPQNVIDMHAYGDTKLLVPTGPGVREPQNRRVEIVFH
jgi:OOP family OmpA-OmpF porin